MDIVFGSLLCVTKVAVSNSVFASCSFETCLFINSFYNQQSVVNRGSLKPFTFNCQSTCHCIAQVPSHAGALMTEF